VNAQPIAAGDETAAQPTEAGLTTRVVKGSLWTLLGQIVPLLLSFVTARYVVLYLDATGYGALQLFTLIPAYLSFADFGMGTTSTRFASQAFAEGDRDKEARVVRTAALIAFLSSLPFALFIFAFSSWLAVRFNVPEEFLADASLGIKLAAATFVVNLLNAILNTPQLTRLRMDLNMLVTTGFRVVGMIATPIVLYLGWGLAGASAVLLATSLLTLAGHLAASRRLLPDLFSAGLARGSIRQMLAYGGAFAGAGLAGVFLLNAERGILSITNSTEALGYYTIAFTFSAIAPMFSVAMIQSLIPAFSQLQGKENLTRLRGLYSRGIRLNLIVMLPALVMLAVVGKDFLTLWLKKPSFAEQGAVPLYILLFGLAFTLFSHFPYVLILAAGRTDIFAKMYWVQLALYLPLVWFLTSHFGIVGAAMSWSIRGIVDTFCLVAIARRVTGVKPEIPRAGRFAMAVSIMLLPLGLYFYTGGLGIAVIAASVAASTVYLLLVWRWVLEPEEATWLAAQLRRRLPVGVN
jgi:O-antigen/teichoic acid export membrane protein